MTTFHRYPLGTAIAFAIASTVSTTVFADTTRLDTVIITADRFEQSLTDTIAPVSVVTREELDERNVQSVAQAISLLPSVSLKSSGGEGQQTGIFIRGTNSKQVLVLVDGQRISSSTTGETALNLFPVELIERIEYVRGAGSSLYGSDAMGGIIQVFTRQPKDTGTGHVTVSLGTQGSRSINGSWANAITPNTRYSISASAEKTNGFDALQDSEADDDGYRNTSIQAKLDHTLSDNWAVKLNSALWVGESEYDNSGNNQTVFENMAHGLILTHTSEQTETDLSVGYSQDENISYGNGTNKEDGSKYVTENVQTSLISRININDTTSVALGVDFNGDDVSESGTDYDVKDRERFGVFAKGSKSIENLTLEAGVRRNRDSQFDYYNTWSLGAAYQLSETLRLHASHGKAFRAPTYNELYWPSYGNPDLLPETLHTTEISLSGDAELPWTISAYYSRATDLISGGDNVDEATLKGLEASVDFFTGDFDHSVVAEFSSAERDDNGNDLRYRPTAALKLISAYSALDWSVGTEFIAQKGVYTNTSNTESLAGFGTLNLFANKELAADWTLSGRIDNLLDRDYYTNYDSWNAQYYNSTPLSASISLTRTF